jgi:hypothetical protein
MKRFLLVAVLSVLLFVPFSVFAASSTYRYGQFELPIAQNAKSQALIWNVAHTKKAILPVDDPSKLYQALARFTSAVSAVTLSRIPKATSDISDIGKKSVSFEGRLISLKGEHKIWFVSPYSHKRYFFDGSKDSADYFEMRLSIEAMARRAKEIQKTNPAPASSAISVKYSFPRTVFHAVSSDPMSREVDGKGTLKFSYSGKSFLGLAVDRIGPVGHLAMVSMETKIIEPQITVKDVAPVSVVVNTDSFDGSTSLSYPGPFGKYAQQTLIYSCADVEKSTGRVNCGDRPDKAIGQSSVSDAEFAKIQPLAQDLVEYEVVAK